MAQDENKPHTTPDTLEYWDQRLTMLKAARDADVARYDEMISIAERQRAVLAASTHKDE